MNFQLPPNLSVQSFSLGQEGAPLLVIDHCIDQPELLLKWAAASEFVQPKVVFPGLRAVAPPAYQYYLAVTLLPLLRQYFDLVGDKLRFSMCHYSLVTTPPEKLALIQRIPHVDSFDAYGLATVHYLFRKPLGGTAFYRHRKTGFEVINEARKLEYFRSLEAENDGPNLPQAGYINGDTPLFEQIAKQDAVFNRMLVYRRSSLHSGCIDSHFVPDSNPLTGRLSINSFLDVVAK
ncbi:DUF6445 family protein [Gilvimarinus polysaccharolyticus]|uniref:DUF6445 family protein n=1 Tax=Gilvimarinus polysaccharolyticus TaxID=863921 RepID=UPI00067398B4|nr:DUF6445 family protein [Gilvimarinus polysaccharolyticus]